MQAIIESLGFNVQVYLMQVVLFLVLWLVLQSIFWKPIMAHLQGREDQVRNAYETIEETRRDMENLRADYQTRIGQVEAEARASIQGAVKEAQAERERIIKETREQSEKTIQQGLADMEREKEQALSDLRQQMVGLAVNAADLALGSTADTASLRRSIEARVLQGASSAARN